MNLGNNAANIYLKPQKKRWETQVKNGQKFSTEQYS